MIRRPPRSTRTDTLFPYTTLFRSCLEEGYSRERISSSLQESALFPYRHGDPERNVRFASNHSTPKRCDWWYYRLLGDLLWPSRCERYRGSSAGSGVAEVCCRGNVKQTTTKIGRASCRERVCQYV